MNNIDIFVNVCWYLVIYDIILFIFILLNCVVEILKELNIIQNKELIKVKMNKGFLEKVSFEFDFEGLVENSQVERKIQIIFGEIVKVIEQKYERGEYVGENQDIKLI